MPEVADQTAVRDRAAAGRAVGSGLAGQARKTRQAGQVARSTKSEAAARRLGVRTRLAGSRGRVECKRVVGAVCIHGSANSARAAGCTGDGTRCSAAAIATRAVVARGREFFSRLADASTACRRSTSRDTVDTAGTSGSSPGLNQIAPDLERTGRVSHDHDV
jgi:hypothetical protein